MKGSLLLIDFDDLMMKFARRNDLADFSILIASSDIIGSKCMRATNKDYGTYEYKSKYDNIEFVDTIRPTSRIMSFCEPDNLHFAEAYEQQLLDAEPFNDICAIVDMVVNQGCNVIIVMAAYEVMGNTLGLLQLFLEEQFYLRAYTFDSLERLALTFDNKPLYRKVVASLDFPVPEEFDGSDFTCILQNIGDRKKIKEQLEFQKGIAAELRANANDDEDALINIYFNRFTESLEDKVREALLKRDIEAIKEICRTRKIRIGINATKESLVDRILQSMRLTSNRIIRYEHED